MFKSETYGKVEIKEIPEKMKKFYDEMKKFETPFQIVVGTDS